jgi:hypothetical protein
MRVHDGHMEVVQHLVGPVIAAMALCLFALLIWAGQHQS